MRVDTVERKILTIRRVRHEPSSRPFACHSTLEPYARFLLLRWPDPGPFNRPDISTASGGRELRGRRVRTVSLKSEAASRGVRMLRTAMGPAITGWLEDPAVVEVMLNPDGRLWIDRLAEGLADTGSDCRRRTASASCVSSPTMSAPRCILNRREFRPSCRRPGAFEA